MNWIVGPVLRDAVPRDPCADPLPGRHSLGPRPLGLALVLAVLARAILPTPFASAGDLIAKRVLPVDTWTGVENSIPSSSMELLPSFLYLDEPAQLAARLSLDGPDLPSGDLVWTSLTPLTLAITSSGFATPLQAGSWIVRANHVSVHLEAILHGETARSVSCAAGGHDGTPASPVAPAPPVKRLIILNQYPEPESLNPAFANAADALRTKKYNGDDVIVIRLGVGGVASLHEVEQQLIAAGIGPGQLSSIDLIGHGNRNTDGDGRATEHELLFGSGERLMNVNHSKNSRLRKFEDRASLYHTPKEFAARFGPYMAVDAPLGLFHCFGADSSEVSSEIRPLARTLRNEMQRDVLGYYDECKFNYSPTDPSLLFLPQGKDTTFRRQNVDPTNSRLPERLADTATGASNPPIDGIGDPEPSAALTDEEVTVHVYTVAGRLVRRLSMSLRQVASGGPRWDGRDDRGSRLRPGVYLYRVRSPALAGTSGRFLILQ